MRRRGLICDKRQLEVVDDPVHHGIVRKESYDLHCAPALRTEHRVDFINLADYLSPALGRDAPERSSGQGILNQPGWKESSIRPRSRWDYPNVHFEFENSLDIDWDFLIEAVVLLHLRQAKIFQHLQEIVSHEADDALVLLSCPRNSFEEKRLDEHVLPG